MKFSYKLQELRKGSGMSQEEFAELLGVSRQSVSKWESGKGYPEIDKLIFISNYFNTSLDLLLKDSSEDDIPSTSTSKKNIKSTKKTKSHISLTKPQDTPKYTSDPLPEPNPVYSSTPETKQQSYPLRSVRVASSSQVRPIKKHIFGNKKLSKKGIITFVLAIIFLCAVAHIMDLVGVSSNAPYIADETTSVGEVYYDDYYETYGTPSWEDLYDGEIDSEDEQNILNTMLNDEQSILMDSDRNIYYSGYDAIGTYLNAQWEMQCDLDCRELYEKYLSFKQNNTYLELYSTEYDEWVIINANMVYTYSDGGSNGKDYSFPSTIISYDDILSNPNYYKDCDIAPYYPVVRLDNNNSNALVSSDIFNTCLNAITDRKILPMSQYINIYESFSDEYELVQYDNDIAFVPKEFIMVNANSIDENNLEPSEEQEQIESVEIVEGVVEKNILDDDIVQEN